MITELVIQITALIILGLLSFALVGYIYFNRYFKYKEDKEIRYIEIALKNKEEKKDEE